MSEPLSTHYTDSRYRGSKTEGWWSSHWNKGVHVQRRNGFRCVPSDAPRLGPVICSLGSMYGKVFSGRADIEGGGGGGGGCWCQFSGTLWCSGGGFLLSHLAIWDFTLRPENKSSSIGSPGHRLPPPRCRQVRRHTTGGKTQHNTTVGNSAPRLQSQSRKQPGRNPQMGASQLPYGKGVR